MTDLIRAPCVHLGRVDATLYLEFVLYASRKAEARAKLLP